MIMMIIAYQPIEILLLTFQTRGTQSSEKFSRNGSTCIWGRWAILLNYFPMLQSSVYSWSDTTLTHSTSVATCLLYFKIESITAASNQIHWLWVYSSMKLMWTCMHKGSVPFFRIFIKWHHFGQLHGDIYLLQLKMETVNCVASKQQAN